MSWDLLLKFMLLGFYTSAIIGLIFKWYFLAKFDYTARIVMAMSDALEKIKKLRQKEDASKC